MGNSTIFDGEENDKTNNIGKKVIIDNETKEKAEIEIFILLSTFSRMFNPDRKKRKSI
jgi:hypothetical protein